MTKEQFESLCNSKETYHVRIRSIEFTNFRNIEHGCVDLPNSGFEAFSNNEPSILGLYGQNGSGKTSVIMALGLLKSILSGTPINAKKYASCIRYGHDRCSLKFTFSMICIKEGLEDAFSNLAKMLPEAIDTSVLSDSVFYQVEYGFDLLKEKNHSDNNESGEDDTLIVENEYLATKPTSRSSKPLMSKQVLFDTAPEASDIYNRPFGNKTKYKLFVGNNPKIKSSLNNLKAVTRSKGLSFLFSAQFINLLADNPMLEQKGETFKEALSYVEATFVELNELYQVFQDNADLSDCDDISDKDIEQLEEKLKELASFFSKIKDFQTISTAFIILYWFSHFGKYYLHVIETSVTGITNQNDDLPLLLWDWNDNRLLSTQFMLHMNEPSEVFERSYNHVKHAIMSISKALSKIVPGVSLEIIDCGTKMGKKEELHRFEIESVRGDVHLPLKYESDGVRRIISILSLLIAAYNQQTFTIAIDEIDSGIFEYLLGVILNLMGKTAKGQLIFTSHNLRPLEMLPDKFLCFTTVNPQNRFTSLKKRGNSNLRDCYFRSIVLGTNGDAIYNSTDQYDIEEAFLLAGKKDESV